MNVCTAGKAERFESCSNRLRSQQESVVETQFLLARLRRAFLDDSPTPGGSLRFAHRGANFLHAYGVQTSGPKGCAEISPGLSEAIAGVIATLYTEEEERNSS